MKFQYLCLTLLLVACQTVQSNSVQAEQLAPGLQFVDEYNIRSDRNLWTDYPATNSDGTVNAIVEIPTGTLAKWEVLKSNGQLNLEIRNGKPRIVQYLGYPGNYGMIPRSVLAKEQGGDGDPLDVIILGPAVPRGSVVKVKLIGVLKLLDKGEQDDKLIAVMVDTPLYSVNSIEELNQKYPGVTSIVETWFSNYKGPGASVQVQGFRDQTEAQTILQSAISAYTSQGLGNRN